LGDGKGYSSLKVLFLFHTKWRKKTKGNRVNKVHLVSDRYIGSDGGIKWKLCGNKGHLRK